MAALPRDQKTLSETVHSQASCKRGSKRIARSW
jgi:hypothetical protein